MTPVSWGGRDVMTPVLRGRRAVMTTVFLGVGGSEMTPVFWGCK